jgi:hypothetical protein
MHASARGQRHIHRACVHVYGHRRRGARLSLSLRTLADVSIHAHFFESANSLAVATGTSRLASRSCAHAHGHSDRISVGYSQEQLGSLLCKGMGHSLLSLSLSREASVSSVSHRVAPAYVRVRLCVCVCSSDARITLLSVLWACLCRCLCGAACLSLCARVCTFLQPTMTHATLPGPSFMLVMAVYSSRTSLKDAWSTTE